MTETSAETLSVVVEREIPYPPEKIWRALTQPYLIEEQSGFRPDQPQYYQGAKDGWQRFFANLEQVLARIE
jgi:uncharacterized protein YndB with AHSA1/START domain